MKIINSVMISILSIALISCSGGSDKNMDNSTATMQEKSAEKQATNDHKHMAAASISDADQTTYISSDNKSQQTVASSLNKANSESGLNQESDYYTDEDSYYASNDGGTDSSYDQYDSTYGDSDSSYNQYDSSYSDTGYNQYGSSSTSTQNNSSGGSSSYGQNSSSGSSGGMQSQANSADNSDDAESDSQASDSEDDSKAEDDSNSDVENAAQNAGMKYQRLYDNGIIWYGSLGTLTVQYQSSHTETTGIGFRVHYDNSSMRVASVTSYPVDSIVAPSSTTLMPDANNFDNNASTSHYLPFAWASIYGQWPQANQVTLATIEFERLDGGSGNYNINYSPISVAAGFRFIQ